MPTWTSGTGNGYRHRVTATVMSQNTTNRTSVIRWTYEVINPSNRYFNAQIAGSLVLGGVTLYTASGTFNSSPSGSTKIVASGSRTYSHDSGGQLSLSLNSSMRTLTQGSSWSMPSLSVSGTMTAPGFNMLPGAPSAMVAWLVQPDRLVRAEVATVSGSILEYAIERRNNRSGSWSSWIRQSVGLTMPRRIEFDPGTAPATYQFRGLARTSVGWGPYSSVASLPILWAPDKLDNPTVSIDATTGKITVTAPVATARGTPIRSYQIMSRNNSSGEYGGWSYHNVNANRQYIFDPHPYTGYGFRARAMSNLGEWHTMSESDTVVTQSLPSGPKIFSDDSWRNTQAYVKVNGVWKPATTHMRSGGVWRKTT